MELMVLGGDLRMAYLAAMARAQGIDAVACGLENAPVKGVRHEKLTDIAFADHIAMMNPFPKGLSSPYAERPVAWETALQCADPGTKLILFGTTGMPDWVKERFTVVDLSDDEVFLIENAHLTAEGAIFASMQKSAAAIHRNQCLVIGFGRIGMALTRMLTGFGARVTVAARRENARARARMFGAIAVDMEEMKSILPAQRIIFTTPPERVLEESDLRMIAQDAMLIELASAPYGFDMDCAKRLGLNAWLEAAVPGRYCPESAARVLLSAVTLAMKNEGGDLE